MFEQPRWQALGLVPIAAGLTWLWWAASFGVVGFLFSVIPGLLLTSSGVAALLWPGDLRIPQYAALGAFLGVPFALPVFWAAGPGTALVLIAGCAASFLTAGAISVRQEPHTPGVPEPEPSLPLDLKVACDDALLAFMGASIPIPSGADRRRIHGEVRALREQLEARGLLDKPADYHRTPPPLEGPSLRPRRARGLDYEHLVFESGWEPPADEPGRERWLSYRANRTAHAWVVRHADPGRPWVLAIHGYQMGRPGFDFLGLDVARLHRRLGLNVVVPVLPLHGPRRIGRISGDGYLSGDAADTLHAQAQAMWDCRRLLSWMRAEGAPAIGVYGLSLGGYNTALLASLDGGLACAVAGIPVTDFAGVFWRHGPALQLRYLEHLGIEHDEVHDCFRVISPLALEPKVPHAHRHVFGAVADRLVPAKQVHDLWVHWERPSHLWYQGSHVSVLLEPGVRRFVSGALRGAGLAAEPVSA